MALSAFSDKTVAPRPNDLKTVLGRTAGHWESLRKHLASVYVPLDETWNFAGAKWGWSLRLKHKKRTILYMTPCKGHFLVGFVLGEKAVKAAHQSQLSERVLVLIDEAKKYPEGRGVRIEVRNRNDRENVEQLAEIKMAN